MITGLENVIKSAPTDHDTNIIIAINRTNYYYIYLEQPLITITSFKTALLPAAKRLKSDGIRQRK